jgi:hypothetical protein
VVFKDELAARIRTAVAGRPGVTERAMFGGIAFMLDGNMFIGTLTPGFARIPSGGLMVRVGPGAHDAALAEPHVLPMVMGARTMAGYAAVLPAGCATVAQVRRWAERAIAFVGALPVKPVKPVKAATVARPAKTVKTVKAATVARPVKTVETVKTVQATAAKTAKPVQAAKTTAAMTPKPVQAAKTTAAMPPKPATAATIAKPRTRATVGAPSSAATSRTRRR